MGEEGSVKIAQGLHGNMHTLWNYVSISLFFWIGTVTNMSEPNLSFLYTYLTMVLLNFGIVVCSTLFTKKAAAHWPREESDLST